MYITTQNILLVGSILLFISVWVSQGSYKFGIPALLLFLGVGMLAGTEGVASFFGTSGIVFDNPKLAQFIGAIALIFILFSGGMDTKWRSIRPVIKEGLVLSSLGVILTAACIGVFVYIISDFTWAESFLLGSIVSSTDAASVFSILRSSNLSLKNNLKPLLELESGSNDPVAYLLTILFIGIINQEASTTFGLVPDFIIQIGAGALIGYLMGRLSVYTINKIKTQYNGLYPVMLIALMFFTYSCADLLHGNGFLSVYIAGIIVGNKRLLQKELITGSFDGFAWLMQVVLFLILGLQVVPSEMIYFLGIGMLVSVFIMFLARPISIFLTTVFFRKMNLRNKIFVSWVGLRGAAPIVFATYPMIAGLEKSNAIFNIVFIISCSSMLIQGTTIPLVAKWLKVSLIMPKFLISRKELDLENEIVEVKIPLHSNLVGASLNQIKFPNEVRITMMERQGEYLPPNGHTKLNAGDHLFIMCKETDMNEIYELID